MSLYCPAPSGYTFFLELDDEPVADGSGADEELDPSAGIWKHEWF